MIFPGRNTPNNKDLDATNKKILKGHVAPLLKYIYYELRSINRDLEGAAFSASTIC